jgi:hypothetical protein
MRRRKTTLPVDLCYITVGLTPEQKRRLDDLAGYFKMDRQQMLVRGLFVLDVLYTAVAAPVDAELRLSVHCPIDGAEMFQVPML